MSRKRTFNINRFDGGITDDIRTSDLSKCAFVSHFDIYRDPSRLYPMPGYTADMNDGSTATGMKQYGVRAFFYGGGTLRAVGTKSDGTGSKLFEKATAETASWTASTTGEGTDDLAPYTFLYQTTNGRVWYLTVDGTTTYFSYYSATVTDKAATFETFLDDITPIVAEFAYNDAVYLNSYDDDVLQLNTTSVTDPAKDTAIYVRDVQSGDEQLGVFGYRFYPYKSQLLLWDGASVLADRKIEFGKGIASALGYVNGVWVGVVNENISAQNPIFDEETNGEYAMSIKYPVGSGTNTLLRIRATENTNGRIIPLRSTYKDAFLFYARVHTSSTTYKQGIWAVGQAREGSPLAVSLLMDMGTLGSLEGFYNFGKHFYFAHNDDGSITRLNPFNGTYDITAIYESVMMGYDTPEQKNLKGISVVTEGLPSGATVEVKYRTDEDSSWTSMGTSTTVGKQRHTFTINSDGTQIGLFQEIQFRVEVTGNAPIKSITTTLFETDNLPYTA